MKTHIQRFSFINYFKGENKNYSYWRNRIMLTLIIGYASYYLVRMNFAIAVPFIKTEFSLTNYEVGWIFTLHSLLYGIGKLFNGYLSDRINPRIFMPIGLLLSATVTGLMGLSTSFLCIGALYILNAYFQSMGFPPIARSMVTWFSKKERGSKWALCSTSHQIGGAIIMLFGGAIIHYWNWRMIFILPAIFTTCIAIYLFNRLRGDPATLGLPPIEIYKDESLRNPNESKRVTFRTALNALMKTRSLRYLCIANMCLYVVRMGVFNWAPSFLMEFKGSNLILAGGQTAIYEIAGLFGTIAAGVISDKYFKGERSTFCLLSMVILTIALGLFIVSKPGNVLFDTLFIFIIGAFIYSAQVLAGIASVEVSDKEVAGMANGLLGVFGNIGTAISGLLVGVIVGRFGWNAGLIFFMLAGIVSAWSFYQISQFKNIFRIGVSKWVKQN